jgi:hypothetical protein
MDAITAALPTLDELRRHVLERPPATALTRSRR